MKLADIYKLAIKKGIGRDPRSQREISEELARSRREFISSNGVDRKAFDKERLSNPYADTRILYGDLDADVKSIMVGIDMEGPEILLADRINERRPGSIDLVMAHHPEGKAWAKFYDVMRLQIISLSRLGLSKEIAEDMLKDRMGEVGRAVSASNHYRSVDFARILNIPYMCVHTPADNHVNNFLQKIMDHQKPKRLIDIVSILKSIPEYKDAVSKNAGPHILVGDPKKKAGKVFVDMTGGTEGPKRVFARLSQAGVGTIVGMHLSEDHYKHAKEEHINVVIAGHIASDTLGLNLLLDEIDKVEQMKIVPCSGFTRVRR